VRCTLDARAPLGISIAGAFILGGRVNTPSGLTFIGATPDNYLRAFALPQKRKFR